MESVIHYITYSSPHPIPTTEWVCEYSWKYFRMVMPVRNLSHTKYFKQNLSERKKVIPVYQVPVSCIAFFTYTGLRVYMGKCHNPWTLSGSVGHKEK